MNVHVRAGTYDDIRQQREQKRKWKRAKQAEGEYARRLRDIADQIGKLVDGLVPDDLSGLALLEQTLRKYAEIITPWARATSAKMIADVQRKDEAMWRQLSKDMGASIRQEIAKAPTGQLLRDLMNENVVLITSLPTEAAQRVHELAIKGISTGERFDHIRDEIMRTGEVTRSRATLIARTETARAASTLIEARATHIGCTHYRWRTVEDGAVRKDHRLLNGKIFSFASPPISDRRSGTRAHPGQIWNCRCWPEPILPENSSDVFADL